MSRPSAFMVSTFPPPLAGKGQILRLQREPPPLLSPAHPPPEGRAGPTTASLPPPPPRIPAGTHSHTNPHKPQAHTDTCAHTAHCANTHTHKRHTQMHNFRQRCAHKRAETHSHRVLANTEEKPPWQGWEALQRRLGGKRGEAGQCEATVQSWNPRHGDATTTSSSPKPCVPIYFTLHWAPSKEPEKSPHIP